MGNNGHMPVAPVALPSRGKINFHVVRDFGGCLKEGTRLDMLGSQDWAAA